MAINSTGVLVLAAGKGTRMYSQRPKVLQELLEEPMLQYIYDALETSFSGCVWTVIGHQAEQVRLSFPDRDTASWIEQKEQLGTGHALQIARPCLADAGLETLIILNGDTPLITGELVDDFLAKSLESQADLAFLTLELENPGAYGRVVREPQTGRVKAIVEAKDFDPERYGPEPNEVNSGIYVLKFSTIYPLLDKLTNDNKSGEYYITDLVALAVDQGLRVEGVCMGDDTRLMGINTPLELVEAEQYLQRQIVDGLMRNGCIIRASESVRVGPKVRFDKGVSVTGPCEMYGNTTIACGTVVQSHTVIRNCEIGENSLVKSFCMLEDAIVGAACNIGPYGRLRPDAVLEDKAQIGNFVEVKKSVLREGVKANHLTYIGDADIGAYTNIGAGTITCNYDGKNKHKTQIGERSFIGSNTAFVAPVVVGKEVLVGAGSVITSNVPDKALAVARARQSNLKRTKS